MAFHNSGIICKPIIALGKMLQKSKMDDYDHQCHQGSKVFASVATWTEELKFCFNWNWNNFLQRYCSIYRNMVHTYFVLKNLLWEKIVLVIEKTIIKVWPLKNQINSYMAGSLSSVFRGPMLHWLNSDLHSASGRLSLAHLIYFHIQSTKMRKN